MTAPEYASGANALAILGAAATIFVMVRYLRELRRVPPHRRDQDFRDLRYQFVVWSLSSLCILLFAAIRQPYLFYRAHLPVESIERYVAAMPSDLAQFWAIDRPVIGSTLLAVYGLLGAMKVKLAVDPHVAASLVPAGLGIAGAVFIIASLGPRLM